MLSSSGTSSALAARFSRADGDTTGMSSTSPELSLPTTMSLAISTVDFRLALISFLLCLSCVLFGEAGRLVVESTGTELVKVLKRDGTVRSEPVSICAELARLTRFDRAGSTRTAFDESLPFLANDILNGFLLLGLAALSPDEAFSANGVSEVFEL